MFFVVVVVVVTISLFFILLCLLLHFQALLNKEIKPPFTPEVKGELDTAYVSSSLVNQEARDSATEKPKKKGDAPKFDQFTYVGDSAMGGDR